VTSAAEISARILVIDDDPDVLALLQTMLSGAGYEVATALDGREALASAWSRPPDLVLLDVLLPGLSGWEICAALKSSPETQEVPVAILSARNEIRDMITSMQAGADDYVPKPFTRQRLLATVSRLLERRPEQSPSRVFQRDERLLNPSLLYDPVTRLPTVPVVIDALRDRLMAERELGVMYVDVEKYSHVEETYGWEVFDSLVRETSRALKQLIGTVFATGDVVAINRPAGSEFVVFTDVEPGDPSGARLARKARQAEETLRAALDESFRERIHKPIGVVVGHALVRRNAQMRTERVVYRAIREALLVATSREGQRLASMREAFRRILERNDIRTVFQPIFDLDGLRLYGHEALTRGPAASAFESADVLFQYAIANDAVWELEGLCLASTASRYGAGDGTILFVNVEADLINSLPDGRGDVFAPLRRLRREIVLEVTERAAIRDVPTFRAALEKLREDGFRIAIDDAGSGYASLQAIAELKPDFLKVASTLVTGLARDPIKRDIVEMLLHVARRIDARCVAEGIETEEDLDECRRIGIPHGQGFFLGLPAEWVPEARAEVQ
jgi:EAL domain-containing protein (putative c-di-GMP-specific phosphodiesterase class I)/DNA-binding response OmpR family regulator